MFPKTFWRDSHIFCKGSWRGSSLEILCFVVVFVCLSKLIFIGGFYVMGLLLLDQGDINERTI